MTRVFSVPFQFNVPAGAGANQSSNLIQGISMLIGAALNFPIGTGGLLLYQFLESPTKPLVTTAVTGGRDVSSDVINPALYVGDGVIYSVPWQKTPNTPDEYIIMNAINSTGINLVASAIVWLSK